MGSARCVNFTKSSKPYVIAIYVSAVTIQTVALHPSDFHCSEPEFAFIFLDVLPSCLDGFVMLANLPFIALEH